jgi:CXXC-20-CXXC protein
MNLPKCPNCSHQFSWGSVFKTLWKIDQKTECPNCGTILYPSSESRQKVGFVTLIPLLVAFGFQTLGISYTVTIPLFILMGIGVGSLIPYFYSFVNKEESLW